MKPVNVSEWEVCVAAMNAHSAVAEGLCCNTLQNSTSNRQDCTNGCVISEGSTRNKTSWYVAKHL